MSFAGICSAKKKLNYIWPILNKKFYGTNVFWENYCKFCRGVVEYDRYKMQ